MQRKRRTAVLAGLIVFTFSLHALADAEEFSISKKSKDRNWLPAVAVSTKTKGILVVWASEEPKNRPSYSKIYGALISYRKNRIRVRKARLLSIGSDYHTRPEVAYSPESNGYLVVWQVARKPGGIITTDVLGRAVSKSGKPKGPVLDLAADVLNNEESPKIVYLPNPPVPTKAAAKEPEYFLIWNQSTFSGDIKDSGIYSTFLAGNGTILAPEKLAYRAKVDPFSDVIKQISPFRMISARDGSFFIGLTQVVLSSDPPRKSDTDVRLLLLDKFGLLDGSVKLDEANAEAVSVAQLSAGVLLTPWTRPQEFKILNQAIKTKPRKFKKSYKPVKGGWSDAVELISLEEGAYQIVNGVVDERGGVYGIKFNGKAKKAGGPVLLDVPFISRDFRALRIPGTDKMIVVNTKEGKNDAGIVGYMTDMK